MKPKTRYETRIVPKNKKIYSTLARCCKYANVLPSGAQSVSNQAGKPIGFAALPERLGGVILVWKTET